MLEQSRNYVVLVDAGDDVDGACSGTRKLVLSHYWLQKHLLRHLFFPSTRHRFSELSPECR